MQNATRRALQTIVILLVAATPLALIPGVFLSHDVIPKTFLLLAGAAFLLFLLPQWAREIPNIRSHREGKWFLIIVAAQAASCTVSTFFSTQPMLSFAGTVWRRLGSIEQAALLTIATAAACLACASSTWPRQLERWMVACAGLASIYGILQYFRIDPFLSPSLYTIEYYGGVLRPPATLGHALYFAAYLAPVALIAVSLALKDTGLWRLVAAAVAFLAPVAIVLSGTRGSLLALIAGLVLLASQSGSTRRIAMIGGAALLVIAGITLSPAGANLRHRFTQMQEDLGGPRLQMWRESPQIAQKYPMFGSGPETFATEFRRIQSPALSRAYPEFYQETPHNIYIDALTSQGFPGLLILAGILWLGRRSPPVAAMAVGGLFASFSQITFMYVFLLAGLSAAKSPQPAKPKSAKPKPGKKAPTVNFGYWHIPTAVAGALFAAVAVLLTIQDAAFAHLRDATAAHDLPAAESAWNTAERVSFGMPGYQLWASRQFSTLGVALTNKPGGVEAWKDASQASEQAETEDEERFSAIYQSAILAIAANDLPRAEAKAKQAIEIAPNWYKPHLLLAQIFQASGKSGQAAVEGQISAGLGWNPRQ